MQPPAQFQALALPADQHFFQQLSASPAGGGLFVSIKDPKLLFVPHPQAH
jgi:hypothetical protein